MVRRLELALGLAAGILGVLAGWDIVAFHIDRVVLQTPNSRDLVVAFGPGIDEEARGPTALLVALAIGVALSALLRAWQSNTLTAALVTALAAIQIVCTGLLVPSDLQAYLPPLQISPGSFFAVWPTHPSIGALFIPAALASLACVVSVWAPRPRLRLRLAAM